MPCRGENCLQKISPRLRLAPQFGPHFGPRRALDLDFAWYAAPRKGRAFTHASSSFRTTSISVSHCPTSYRPLVCDRPALTQQRQTETYFSSKPSQQNKQHITTASQNNTLQQLPHDSRCFRLRLNVVNPDRWSPLTSCDVFFVFFCRNW